MGWLHIRGASKDYVVRELTQGWNNPESGASGSVLAHTLRGNVLYCVHEQINTKTHTVERFIGVHLLSVERGDWGYKRMDEGMHPYYYDCPVSYFHLAGVASTKRAQEWRNKVIEHAGNKASKKGAKVGDIIVFRQGTKYGSNPLTREKVEMVVKTKVYVRINGFNVRVMPKHIERIEHGA